jgi:hypothetical protein
VKKRESLPFLQHRPDVDLVSKTSSSLRVQIPVRLRDVIGGNFALGRRVLEPLLGHGSVNDTINDGVGDVHTSRREFLCNGCAQRAQCKFATSESRHLRAGFDARSGAGEDQRGRVFGAGIRSSL